MTKYIFLNEYFSTPWNGFGGRTFYLAQAMGKEGHDVSVISSRNHHHLQKSYGELDGLSGRIAFNLTLLPAFHYKVSTSKLRMLNWTVFCVLIPFLALKFIRHRGNAVVIYSSPSFLGGLGGWALARLLGAKFIFEVRDIWPLSLVEIGGYSPNNFAIRVLSKLEIFLYRRSDAIFSNLQYLDQYLASLNISRPFCWLPNGVTRAELAEASARVEQAAPKSAGYKFIVGYSGSLGEANELKTLLDTSARLDADRFETRILGDGSKRAELEAYASSLGGCEVKFLGRCSKDYVAQFLKEADCLFIGLPKRDIFKYGVSPNKLFEYLLAGKPILYGIDSGDYDPIEGNRIGYQIDEGDVQKMTASIEKFSALTVDEIWKLRSTCLDVLECQYIYEDTAERLVDFCQTLERI